MSNEKKRVLGRVLASEDIRAVGGGLLQLSIGDVNDPMGTDGMPVRNDKDPASTDYSSDLTHGLGGDLSGSGGGFTDVHSDATTCGVDYPEFP